jgi:Holliday junction resolvasome RuvABC endonuclease subunit
MAINPGSKYLGVAFFERSDLQYWGIKAFKGRYSKEKVKKIKMILSDFINRYGPNILAIKKLHPSRASTNLNQVAVKIRELSRRRGLRICQYSLKDLKNFFSLGIKINKKEMAELTVAQYPFLTHSFEKEKRNKNPYFIRMFEAIALGIVCFNQLDH